MEKHIISQPHGELNAFIHVRLPVLGRAQIDDIRASLDLANNRQARKSRSLKRHGTSRGGKIADYHKMDLISSLFQVGRNIQRVIIPDQRTAPSRSNNHMLAIDIEFVSCIGRKMQ